LAREINITDYPAQPTQIKQAKRLSALIKKVEARLAISDAILTESAVLMARSYENMDDEFRQRLKDARRAP
jgi:hypothetical protein